MVLSSPGYRGKRRWCVSLDGMDPVEVLAPDDAAALIRAAIYYRIDWIRADQRLRFKVWRYADADPIS